jgi:hypothetical protein
MLSPRCALRLPSYAATPALRQPNGQRLRTGCWAAQSEGHTMIIERGARPDAPPKPKRARTVLAGVLGVGVGLVLGLGLGVGFGVLGWAWLRH